jgi:hypothetical protein
MATAKVQERPSRRHTHKPNGPDPATERCPWCGSKISRAAYQRICDQIAEEERSRLAKAEQALRQQLAREQQKATATATAEVEKAKRDAAAQIEKARKEAAAREASVRKQAAETATAALAPKIAAAVADATKGWHGEKVRLTAELEAWKRKIENTHTPAHKRDQVAPAGKYEIAVQSDKLQINGRNANDTGFETIVVFQRRAAGGNIGFGVTSQFGAGQSVIAIANASVTLLHGSVVRRRGLDGVSGPRS